MKRWILRKDGIIQRYNVKHLNYSIYRKGGQKKKGAIVWTRQPIQKEPPIRAHDYELAVYTSEDTTTGTGVKLEMYIKSWKTFLKEEEIEAKKEKLADILIKAIGQPDAEHDKTNIGWLNKKGTMVTEDKVHYIASVLNINKDVKQKIIAGITGWFNESTIFH